MGWKNIVSGGPRASAGVRRVESWLSELGWEADERVGDTGILLNFKDALVGARGVLVSTDDEGDMMSFSCFSQGRFSAADVPGAVTKYLLAQNKQAMFYSWRAREHDGGAVGFAVSYVCLTGGMRSTIFRLICENMVEEVHTFDAMLHKAGAL